MDEAEKRLFIIRRGYEYFRRLQRESGRDRGRYFVFLFSADDEINRWTLYYLPTLRQEMGVSEFLIITPYGRKFRRGEYECRTPYRLMKCNEDEMSAVSAYFYCIDNEIYKRNTVRVLINGAYGITSERLHEYIGYNGITYKEAVALAIFLFPKVPSDEAVERAVGSEPDIREYGIDWGRHGCQETYEKLSYPNSVDKGIMRLMNEGKICKDDEIAVFSATMTTRRVIEILQGYNIVAVLDNDRIKEGSDYAGISVYMPEVFLGDKRKENIKIIVPTRSYVEICEQLDGMGYKIDEQVYVSYTEYVPYNVKQIAGDFYRGQEIYEDIRRRLPLERLYFITFAGIGDTYLAGMYLADRMRYDGVNSGAVIFITETCRRVFSMLDHGAGVSGEYVVGNNDEGMRLLLFMKQVGYDRLNVCNLTHSFDLIDAGYLRGYKGLDFNTMVQMGSYHAPTRKHGVRVNGRDAGHLFREHGLKIGRTVLIAPHAKSARSITDESWATLAERLKDMGYEVCTNISGDERVIEGTIGISVPIEEICDFVEKAGTFIGIRSGLCDLLSKAKARKIILYFISDIWGTDYTFDFFGLKNMGLADSETKEIVIKGEDTDLDKIIDGMAP